MLKWFLVKKKKNWKCLPSKRTEVVLNCYVRLFTVGSLSKGGGGDGRKQQQQSKKFELLWLRGQLLCFQIGFLLQKWNSQPAQHPVPVEKWVCQFEKKKKVLEPRLDEVLNRARFPCSPVCSARIELYMTQMMDRSTFSHVHTGRKRICWSLAVLGFVFWLGCALISEMWSPHHSEAVIQGWQFECLAASSHWERLWRCCFCLVTLPTQRLLTPMY